MVPSESSMCCIPLVDPSIHIHGGNATHTLSTLFRKIPPYYDSSRKIHQHHDMPSQIEVSLPRLGISAVGAELERFKLTNPFGFAIHSKPYAHCVKGRGSFPHVIPRTIVRPLRGRNKAPTALVGYGSTSDSPINIAQLKR